MLDNIQCTFKQFLESENHLKSELADLILENNSKLNENIKLNEEASDREETIK
jgi:hypothetical protein